MPDRLRIPALALLGLSFTTCVDRAKTEDGDEDDDPIVGEWFVNQIDDMAFPLSHNEGDGYNARQGWSMTVEPELVGDFVYYFVYDYMGLETGQFYRLGLTIDASKAPEYRLEIPLGLFPFESHEYTDEGPVPTSYSPTSYGSTYDPDGGTYATEGGTYDTDVTSSTAPGTSGDTDATGTGTTGATDGTGTTSSPLQADPIAPIAIPPIAAPGDPGTLILVCNLVQNDALDCQREPVADDPEAPLHWRFKRANPDKPTGI